MQARNLFLLFSVLMSVALISAEVKDEVPSEVKSDVQGKIEKAEQSEVPVEQSETRTDLSDIRPDADPEESEPAEGVEPVFGILGTCSNPGSYQGQAPCYPAGQYCGECVSFVKVCTKDYRTTSQWVRGVKVRGNSVAQGRAIATFPNGKYSGHAAIYISQNGDGIQVWDQWKGHPVSKRTIRWNGSGISNNGDSFYVIN